MAAAGSDLSCRVAAGSVVIATAATGHLAFGGALVCHLLATAGFLWVARGVLRGSYAPSFTEAVLIAVVLRAVCLPHPLSLSDDVYRYLHEGELVLAGENPYLVSPAQTPEGLRGRHFDDINNPDVPAAYPPAMQYALALGALISPSPIGMKLLFGLCDLLVFVALWRWLARDGGVASRALLHGWCPLMAVEFAGQGHGDSLAVLFMVLALSAAASGRAWAAPTWLAVATAAKFLPALLLPFVLRATARVTSGAVVFAAVLAGLYAWFLADSTELFRGVAEYTARWRSNDSLFAVFHAAAEGFVGLGWTASVDSALLQEPQRLAKVPLALLGVAVLAWCWRRRVAPQRAAYLFFVFFVAATPTLHPWYVAFLVPFLALYPNWGFLCFTGSVFLAYHVLPGWLAAGRWEEVPWVKVLEYLPFYLGVAWLLRSGEPVRTRAEEPRPAP